ncbi:helix-turn-helix domain-containing protein [Paenibacillus antri]|uniref:Helix-turn-helix domain-containing protein n=1 Tax=Paenibacillus antri TaxID=2582848 RepID=A0A5R9G903_9BACL|nr:helix-turn-helix domain-containing protein [Paenibacillus antri]TLS49223.1 helix-turn-helix domain-containing protein [Paenibacillus antri]
MKRSSLYKNMILFGFAISIFPILTLGLFSYMKSSDAIQTHVNRSNIQMMNQMNGNMEQVLRTVDYTLNYVINTNKVQDALFRTLNFTDFQLYNQLKEELNLLQSPDTYVTDVILANPASDWVINNRGLYAFDEYASKATLLELMELEHSTSWVMLDTAALGSSDTESYGCPTTVTLVKKMPLHTSNKRGIALATIPSCSLGAMLDNPPAASEVMVLDASLRIVAHPDASKIGTSLAESGSIAEADLSKFGGASGQFETSVDGEPISVTYVRSDFNGWTYASFTTMSEFTKEARSIGWFTASVCLLILCLCVLFVWLGSRRVYTPIREMFRLIAERLPESTASKKNELQIIDEHIRDLFASNEKMRHELHQNSLQVRTFFLHKLFQGQLGASEIEEKLELFGYREVIRNWNHLAVLTLQIDILVETRYEQKDLDLLLFAAGNIVEEMVPKTDRLPPVILDQTLVTLVGGAGMSHDDFNLYIYKVTEAVQQNMRRYLDLDVSIGISLPFAGVHRASRGYQEGLEALKHRMKLGKGVIVPYSSLNSGKHTQVYFYPTQVENQLIDAIKLADEELASKLLKQWLGEVFLKDRTPHEYQISLIRLLNGLMVVMQEAGIGLDQLDAKESSLYEELLQLYVSAEIENWYNTRIIGRLIRVFQDRQASQYQNISEQIIDIIRSEFDRDLTLEECASRLHYNVFYLSSVFKKETDMSFSDYLSQYRMNMSKKWLVETDMSVKDIAERLTYTNPQNFIRSFKKQEDMTPGQYRAKYGKPGV